jgi:hypothetical protein
MTGPAFAGPGREPPDADCGEAGDPGRVVPAYALTRGRTRPAGTELPLEALVTATELGQWQQSTLTSEGRAIVGLSLSAVSVMEIGAGLRVPVGVARVLVSEMVTAGYLQVHLPPNAHGDAGPGRILLGRLLDGLRAR